MWIRVALDKDSVHYNQDNPRFSYVDGSNMEEFFFNEQAARLLEQDGFLADMWNDVDAMFDWGDVDFFYPDKCMKLKDWLEKRLSGKLNDTVRDVYIKMLDYADKAIEHKTGIAFDF